MSANNIINILEKLISFKSITPNGAGAIEYIEGHLENLGFKCETKTFGVESYKVTNLYAIIGNSSPNICFAGHVDVVPPGDESLWDSDPFLMKIEKNLVFGRGVVDMKGSIACYLSAVTEFLKHSKPKGSISFLITSDEEGVGTNGTIKMLEYIKNHTPKIDFCILGEPTSKDKIGDTIKIGRRGSINFDLKIIGKQGHVAYPQKALNPITILSSILHNLTNLELDSGNKYFEPSNLEVTSIDTGNNVVNIIPESVSMKFNIRFNDYHTAETLYAKINMIVSKHTKSYELKHSCSSHPFIQKYSEQMKKFAKIVEKICNVTPDIETGGGTSDARFIHSYAEIVEFGLNCDTAHKINEYAKISELQLLYNVYYNCLEEFLRG